MSSPINDDSASSQDLDSNLRQVVTPDMVRETRWLRSPKVGDLMSRALKQMSARASLSMQKVMVESSTRWCVASTAL